MPNESTNLKLKLYDPDVDSNVLVYDFLKDIAGYTSSNFVKIDTSINTLHDSIIGTDGNVVFYNKQEVFLAVHPVGSIFLSTSDVEPAGLYGGTWEKIAEERTLMGASTTHPAGTTVDAGLPNITGNFNSRPHVIGSPGVGGPITGADGKLFVHLPQASDNKDNSMAEASGIYKDDVIFFDASRSNPIYGNSTTVQPATYYINIWKRIE